MAAPVDLKASELAGRLVLRIRLRGFRRLAWRFALGAQVIRFGVWICGMQGDVSVDEAEKASA